MYGYISFQTRINKISSHNQSGNMPYNTYTSSTTQSTIHTICIDTTVSISYWFYLLIVLSVPLGVRNERFESALVKMPLYFPDFSADSNDRVVYGLITLLMPDEGIDPLTVCYRIWTEALRAAQWLDSHCHCCLFFLPKIQNFKPNNNYQYKLYKIPQNKSSWEDIFF